MRKVSWRQFADLFGESKAPLSPWATAQYPYYYKRRKLFNALFLWACAVALCLAGSLVSKFAVVLGLALIIYAILTYWRVRRAALNIIVRRRAPEHATERSRLNIRYDIASSAGSVWAKLVLVERFTGARKNMQAKVLTYGLNAHQSYREEISFICDGGVGLQALGPLTISVNDPLGLFEFTVTEDKTETVFINPKIKPLPELKVSGYQDSLAYGAYDVYQRGNSINIRGLREYVHGDALRHVSWRQSFKHQKLMVKEFEKIVNAEITLVIDMDANFHVGSAQNSTWCFTRELALNIVAQQLALGNSVRVLSQTLSIPTGRGPEVSRLLSLKIPSLVPEVTAINLFRKNQELFHDGATLIYVGPVCGGEWTDTLKSLAKKRSQNLKVFGLLVDATSFASKEMLQSAGVTLLPKVTVLPANFVLVENHEDIGKALLKAGFAS